MAVTRGFTGRLRGEGEAQDRVPPGQFVTSDFPVLTAGPTPQTAVADWSLALELLDYIDTSKLRELYLAWCGENGFEPIAIGAAA